MRRRDFIRTSAIPAVAGLGLLSLRGTGDAAAATLPVPLVGRSIPAVLGIRDQIRTVNEMTRKRLDTILPRAMAEAGIDMWIILCAEDRHDHVFKTMIPYNNWCPLTQMLVLYAKDPGGSGKVGTVERLSLARNTDMKGLHANQWDYRAFDVDRKEDQWQCLARTVKERNPKRIAVHESEGIWAASGLSVTDKRKLIEAIGPVYAQRLSTAEPLVTRWLATMLEEDLELCERAHVINHAIVEETLSNRVITPGVTTTDDVVDHYWQRALNLGLSHYGAAPRAVIGRSPEVASKRRGDTVVRRGDILYLETGLILSALLHRLPRVGLRAAARRVRRAGWLQARHGRSEPAAGRLLRRTEGGPHREPGLEERAQASDGARHQRLPDLFTLARLRAARAVANRPAVGGRSVGGGDRRQR